MNLPTLINHFLENSAATFPDKIALIHGQRRLTYRQINNAANHLTFWLVGNNVRKSDRVVLLLENSLEYVVSYYGTLKAGAVAVPLNTDIKPEALAFLLRELEPKLIISNFRYEKLLKSVELSSLNIRNLILVNPKENWSSPLIQVVHWDDVVSENPLVASRKSQVEEDVEGPHALTRSRSDDSFNSPQASGLPPHADPDSLASIIYTSGSTGKPKGVMLSHRNIVSNTLSICQSLELTGDDIQMVVLPFFYVMGKSLLNTHFAVGGTVVINNKFAFPAIVLQEMVAERVTSFSGVPSTFAYLLHRSPLPKYRDQLTSLRYCAQAGGHMARAIKEKLRHTLPEHTKIYIMYGATEASARLSYLDPERFWDKMDSIGQPVDGVCFRILTPEGLEVSPGIIGELTASGPNIMQGYWKDPEETKRVLNGPGYQTGDLAFQDKEGFFYLVGRKDDQLKVGGHRINPQEIQEILLDSGLLVEAVVLGIPDELLGHKIVALAVPNSEESPDKLWAFCSQKLPKYKMPALIRLTKALPKNAAGKIDQARCLEILKGTEDIL